MMFHRLFILSIFAFDVYAYELDSRLKTPFDIQQVMNFMHEKLHDYTELKGELKVVIGEISKRESAGNIDQKLDHKYQKLSELLVRLVNMREWGEKSYTGLLHHSIPKDYLKKCGFSDEDIRDQMTVSYLHFEGDPFRILYEGNVLVITCASLARDIAVRTALLEHTDYKMHQRIVSMAAVLIGEVKPNDLFPLDSIDNREELIKYLAKSYFSGAKATESHRHVFATFLRKKIPQGIRNELPITMEIVIKPVTSRVLALDGKYQKFCELMATYYPTNIVGVTRQTIKDFDIKAVSCILDKFDESGEPASNQDLLYIYLVEEIAQRFFEKFDNRLKLFSLKFDDTRKKFKPKPRPLSMGSQISKANNAKDKIELTIQNFQLEIQDIEARLTTIDAEQKIASSRAAKLASDAKTEKQNQDELKKNVTELGGIIKASSERQDDLKKKHQKLLKDNSDLSNLLPQLIQHKIELERIRVYTTQDIETLEQQILEITRDIEKLNNRIQETFAPDLIRTEKLKNEELLRQQAEKHRQIDELRQKLQARETV